ncbi:MAG: hypothetical protein GXZ07_09650 [Firmicutes bacterium]|nr:hypothetical protein [Bacillota bacterium]
MHKQFSLEFKIKTMLRIDSKGQLISKAEAAPGVNKEELKKSFGRYINTQRFRDLWGVTNGMPK